MAGRGSLRSPRPTQVAYSRAPRGGVQSMRYKGSTMTRWIALLAAALALAGCAGAPRAQHTASASQWNDGVWNSVLGYHGPANAVVAGGPSGR